MHGIGKRAKLFDKNQDVNFDKNQDVNFDKNQDVNFDKNQDVDFNENVDFDNPAAEEAEIMLHDASEEQQHIVNTMRTHNCIVDAVAGSGKTTTCLHIAKSNPDDKILLLTYNAKLKLETRARFAKYGIHNVEVHSYHSFGFRYFSNNCCRDDGLHHVINNPSLYSPKYYFDMVIIDESQDMTSTLYKFFAAIMFHNIPLNKGDEKNHNGNITNVKFCVLGDVRQAIFGYAGADSRFLTMADVILARWTTLPFARCTLSVSYRLTNQMSAFVNNCLLKSDRIKTVKNGPIPHYYVHRAYDNFAAKRILAVIRDNKFEPGDVIIIAPSVSAGKVHSTPLKKTANYLTNAGLMIYYPASDETKIDEDVSRNKVVFSTFHQTKGLERRCVFVFGFDMSYYNIFRETASDDCPNILYVAATRASEQLHIFQEDKNKPLPFIPTDMIELCCKLEGKLPVSHDFAMKSKSISATDLTKFADSSFVRKLASLYETTVVQKKSKKISIPIRVETSNELMKYDKVIQKVNSAVNSAVNTTTSQTTSQNTSQNTSHDTDDVFTDDISKCVPRSYKKKMFEDVSTITGVASLAHYEYVTTGSMTILNELTSNYKNEYRPYLNKLKAELKSSVNNVTMAFIAAVYCEYRSHLTHITKQLSAFDWIRPSDLSETRARVDAQLRGVSAKYEVFGEVTIDVLLGLAKYYKYEFEDADIREHFTGIVGFADIITEKNNVKTLWEIKTVSDLTHEHMMQLCVYMFMQMCNMAKTVMSDLGFDSVFCVVQSDLKNILFEKKDVKNQHNINNNVNLNVNNTNDDVNNRDDTIDLALMYEILADCGQKAENVMTFKLFNILTNEIIQIRATFKNLTYIMLELIRNKCRKTHAVSNEDWLRNIHT